MKSNFKNAVYNVIGFIFLVVVGLITTPYIVHKLGTEIYGIYVLAISLAGILSFLDLGFGQGIIKFVSHYEAKNDFKKINEIVNTSLLINIAMGLLGGLIIFSLSDFLSKKVFKVKPEQIELAVTSFKIVSIGFVLNLISSIFSNIPKALQRYDISVKVQNIVWFLSVMSSVIVLYLGYGLVEMLIFYVIFQFLGLISYFWFSKKLIRNLKLSLKFNKDVFKEIFGFSIFTAINSITGNIVFRLDKMIIAYFLGPSAVTYYQIPFTIVQMANNFVSSVIQFLFPVVSFLNSAGEKDKLKQIYIKSTKYLIAFSLIVFSGLVLFGKPFLKIWMGEEISEISYPLFVIISLVYFFISISNVGFYYYNGLGFSKINMISSFAGAISYVISAIILIPAFNIKGASLSFVFVLLPFPVYIYILNRVLGISQAEYLKMLAKSVALLVLTLALNFVSYFRLIQDIIVYILVNVVILLLVNSFLFVLRILEFGEIRYIIYTINRGLKK
ncbi:MAG: flippase [Candidatus Calescibacterium sp.]|jgi:O-antigen/teichoic acid export membrane protein